MSTPAPSPGDPSPKPRKRAPGTRRTKLKAQAQATCPICQEKFARLTALHVESHGWTLAMWERRFGPIPAPIPRRKPKKLGSEAAHAPSSPPAVAPQVARQVSLQLPTADGRALASAVAHELVADPQFVARLADEVGSAIFEGALRDRLRTGLVAVLSTRLELHGKALAALEAVRKELAEPWRIAQGGEDHAPTPTRDLVAMGQLAALEVKRGEDLVLKAVKLALEEARTRTAAGQGESPLDASRFSGAAERAGVASLPAAERETVRLLLGQLRKGVEARKALVDAEGAKPVQAVVRDPAEAVSAEQLDVPAQPQADAREGAASDF